MKLKDLITCVKINLGNQLGNLKLYKNVFDIKVISGEHVHTTHVSATRFKLNGHPLLSIRQLTIILLFHEHAFDIR